MTTSKADEIFRLSVNNYGVSNNVFDCCAVIAHLHLQWRACCHLTHFAC